MDFEYPFMLFLLLIIPLLGFLFWLALKHNQNMRKQFGDWGVFQRLIPNYASGRSSWKFGLAISAYLLAVLAMANPRMGSRTRKVKREGIDVYIALDISRSMWAEDVTPKGTDRLNKAQMFILKLIEKLRGERIGLIFFAGEAFLQMPLTTDYSAVQLFLHEGIADKDIVQGTAINEVIELVKKSTASSDSENKKVRQKALIILSDGEEHDQKGVAAAKEARQSGIFTFAIAVGSSTPSPIPLKRDKQSGYHADKSGNIVKTKVNKDWLTQLAVAGDGSFFELDNEDQVIYRIQKSLAKIEKGEFAEQQYDEYDTYYQYLLFIAFILLGIELLLSYRKSNANSLAAEEEEEEEKSAMDKIEERSQMLS